MEAKSAFVIALPGKVVVYTAWSSQLSAGALFLLFGASLQATGPSDRCLLHLCA